MIEYKNNTVQIQHAITDKISTFLEEAGAEIDSQTKRNSRVDTGNTRGSYNHVVSTSSGQGEVAIGSNEENAIWEEYGTGEYAIEGNGRKTPWVYQDRKGQWHKTSGKSAKRPLYDAFNSTKGKLENRLGSLLNEI